MMGDKKLIDCWKILLGVPSKNFNAMHLLGKILLIINALLSSFRGTWWGARHKEWINSISDIRNDDVESESNDLWAGFITSYGFLS